jgi:hypothetical protein
MDAARRQPGVSRSQRSRTKQRLQRELQQAIDLHEAGGEAQTRSEAVQAQAASTEVARDEAAAARIAAEVESREVGGSDWATDQQMKKLGIY